MKAVMPAKAPYQCPLCGTPLGGTSVEVVMLDHSGEKALNFDECGHVITFDAMRDAFGIELPY
jgi:hypothetical protein